MRPDRRGPRARRTRHGGALRAPLPGLARGLPARRAATALFNCYEAFIHIVDSMFNQHAKWLKVIARDPVAPADRVAQLPADARTCGGRTTTASRIRIPGFIDHVVNKKAEVIRVYLPPDANTLLSVMDHCLRSRHYVNVVVAGKQPALTYLSMDDAICTAPAASASGSGRRTTATREPDVVMACCGDVPTLETLAAVALLREHLPDLQGARRQRRRPDAAPARDRASARPVRRGVRRAVHRATGRSSSPTTAIRG